MPSDAMPMLLMPMLAMLLGFLTYRLLRDKRKGSPTSADREEDPVVEEARKIRAESRETKMRIEANANARKPTEEDWLRSLGMAKRREDGN